MLFDYECFEYYVFSKMFPLCQKRSNAEDKIEYENSLQWINLYEFQKKRMRRSKANAAREHIC